MYKNRKFWQKISQWRLLLASVSEVSWWVKQFCATVLNLFRTDLVEIVQNWKHGSGLFYQWQEKVFVSSQQSFKLLLPPTYYILPSHQTIVFATSHWSPVWSMITLQKLVTIGIIIIIFTISMKAWWHIYMSSVWGSEGPMLKPR